MTGYYTAGCEIFNSVQAVNEKQNGDDLAVIAIS
jgi:hypothetical protein